MKIVCKSTSAPTTTVLGNRVKMREATVSDAPFLYELRHLTSTLIGLPDFPTSLNDQRLWMEKHLTSKAEYYFVFGAKNDEDYGAVRLYDIRGNKFRWGSWASKPSAPPHIALESALLVYVFAKALGLSQASFEVLATNVSVCRFHERLGATLGGESKGFRHYHLDEEAISLLLVRFEHIFPKGAEIQLPLERFRSASHNSSAKSFRVSLDAI